MKTLKLVGDHLVLTGFTMQEYIALVEPGLELDYKVESFKDVNDILDKGLEIRDGDDPLWDYPLSEMLDDSVEDLGLLYVELTDGETTRYYETLINLVDLQNVTGFLKTILEEVE